MISAWVVTTVGGIKSYEAHYWHTLVWKTYALRDWLIANACHCLCSVHMPVNQTAQNWIISVAELQWKTRAQLRCQCIAAVLILSEYVLLSNQSQDCGIWRYLCEELSDAWQWDLAYESRAWTMLNRTEMSMMRWMCGVKLNERKKSEELRELLGLEPVSLMIKKRK